MRVPGSPGPVPFVTGQAAPPLIPLSRGSSPPRTGCAANCGIIYLHRGAPAARAIPIHHPQRWRGTMKKLRLDDLAVESFNTCEVRREKGTVVGEQMCTCYTVCTCPGCPTCAATCAYTCDDQTCPACPTCANT